MNLRWNPFGEVPERDRGALAIVDMDTPALAARLAQPGFAVELVGACGRGKSMHLHALRAHLGGAPVTLVHEDPRPPIPEAPVVFVDESQRLAKRVRRALFRRRASFVLATHESHADELAEAGIEWVTIAVGGAPSPEKLRAIVARRIAWARRAEGPLPDVAPALLEALSARHGDDLRAIEDALYDHFQAMREPRHEV
jgi:hypothetical protein